jgi:hypothetical protein
LKLNVVQPTCRPLEAQQAASVTSSDEEDVSGSEQLPLLNEQVPMEGRGVISEPLFTGIPVRAVHPS